MCFCMHHALTGQVSAVLDLVGPALVASSPMCGPGRPFSTTDHQSDQQPTTSSQHQQPPISQQQTLPQQQQQHHKNHRTPPPSAVSLAWLRAVAASLLLMHPHHCAAHHTLIACVAWHCAGASAATAVQQPTLTASAFTSTHTNPAAASPSPITTPLLNSTAAQPTKPAESAPNSTTDFNDPQHSVLLREAARLWLGPAAVCEACALVCASKNSTEKGGASATDLIQHMLTHRLTLCMASRVYEVRAGCKALGQAWLQPMLEG